MAERGRPLPKFGEWDVNNPATAEGFTVIFNKARQEKKTRGSAGTIMSPTTDKTENVTDPSPSPRKAKWFCCVRV
ncbi:RPM1-interacting protein 4-like [Herrania umbratica]|uniref:RPM1-interacting protein 4-like n=1 Tax=Herrania umbratica TaxID=108875 RepID=A0A6J1AKB9_9ROSI|nr:RPM1-interacting protein 4-like [Herrania umbratica]